MAKMTQGQNAPDELYRELLRREVARPPRGEVFDRIARSAPTDLGRPAAGILREERRRRA